MVRFLLILWVVIYISPGLAGDKIIMPPDGLGYCATCHGVELKGNPSVDAPNLSVLSSWYVERQLLNFKHGLRAPQGSSDIVGREMQAMAAYLDKESIQAALDFIDNIPEKPASSTINGGSEQGKVLYQTCAVCHGQQGEGNKRLNAPRLAGQSDWYLVRQLENFKAGSRGAATGDISGAQMRAALNVLKDKTAINSVVSYINSFNNPTGD